MNCPLCKYNLADGSTEHALCGWKAQSEKSQGGPSRSWHGIPHCQWQSPSGLCNMLAGKHEPHCEWHKFWQNALSSNGGVTGLTEQQAFEQWLSQFRPGGMYGRNPGQWWPHSGILWDIIHGQDECPVMTLAIRAELKLRDNEVWWSRQGRRMPATDRERLHGRPLPPWTTPEPYIEAEAVHVEESVQIGETQHG